MLIKLLIYLFSKYTYFVACFYLLALCFTPILGFTLFWFWISNINKHHMREKCRLFGIYFLSVYPSMSPIIKIYMLKQFGTLFDCIAGFTDGVLKMDPTFRYTEYKSIEVQTDYIEQKIIIKEIPIYIDIIKEVIREVIREVPIEVIREVIREVPIEVIKEAPNEMIKETPIKTNIFQQIKPSQRITLRKKTQSTQI